MFPQPLPAQQAPPVVQEASPPLPPTQASAFFNVDQERFLSFLDEMKDMASRLGDPRTVAALYPK
jgi:hypothetical protein